jgi:DNA (cytosine-5)-methyltransferase 1
MKNSSKLLDPLPELPVQLPLGPRRRPSKVRAKAGSGFTFIDLFAGIGGMRLGFEAAGGRCVFTSEWDAKARVTYAANFPGGHDPHGDITKIDAASIPAHDILVAGFPCQPFSIAGVSKKNALGRPHGFECKTQGTLFFDVARIIKHHRPAAFLLENVKNLKSHDGGNTFKTILETLRDELGYDVHVRVIDAKGFVPQHRERVFLVGFRRAVDFSFDDLEIPSAESGPRLKDILHPENGSEDPEAPFTEGPRAKVAAKYTLTPNLWEYLQRYAEKHLKKGNGFGFGLVGPNDVARTLSARYYKDGSEILIRRRGTSTPRRLTPRECARLMGFDRNGRVFKIPVSDTRAYKQFGNAVVVPVVQAIARAMVRWMVEVRDAESPPSAKAV